MVFQQQFFLPVFQVLFEEFPWLFFILEVVLFLHFLQMLLVDAVHDDLTKHLLLGFLLLFQLLYQQLPPVKQLGVQDTFELVVGDILAEEL